MNNLSKRLKKMEVEVHAEQTMVVIIRGFSEGPLTKINYNDIEIDINPNEDQEAFIDRAIEISQLDTPDKHLKVMILCRDADEDSVAELRPLMANKT